MLVGIALPTVLCLTLHTTSDNLSSIKDMAGEYELKKMKYGYVRLSKSSPSKEEQEETLTRAGLPAKAVIFVDQIPTRRRTNYVDVTPQRTAMIAKLKEKDVVVIASASRLGTGVTDIAVALEEIAAKQAVVLDAASMETIRWHPDAKAAIDFVLRGQNGLHSEVAARMRSGRTKEKLGGAPRVSDEKFEEARPLFFNTDMHMSEVVRRTGISERSLYRRFGKRTSGP